jgi:hypothetical protein
MLQLHPLLYCAFLKEGKPQAMLRKAFKIARKRAMEQWSKRVIYPHGMNR